MQLQIKMAVRNKLCQMVNLIKNNKPLKMSKRAGNFITLNEIIDEVGAIRRFAINSEK